MKKTTEKKIWLALLFLLTSFSSVADDECREILITQLSDDPITTYKSTICETSTGETITSSLPLANTTADPAPTGQQQSPKKPTEYELSRYDVEVNQRQMRWAAWIGTALAGLASIFLFINFRQIQRANEIGQTAARAFVMAERIEVTEVLCNGPQHSVTGVDLDVKLRNFGSSPAFDIRFSVTAITTAEDSTTLFENTTINIDTGSGTPLIDCPPGQSRKFKMTLTEEKIKTDFEGRFLKNTKHTSSDLRSIPKQVLFIFYRISYLDIQNIRRKHDDCFNVTGWIEFPDSDNVTLNMNHMVRPILNIVDTRGYEYDKE